MRHVADTAARHITIYQRCLFCIYRFLLFLFVYQILIFIKMSETPSTSVMREQIQSSNVNAGMKKIQITQKNREYLVILFQVRAGKVCNITTNVSFMSTSQQ